MPFGFFNTLTTFQGYINKILTKKLNIFVIVYLDDLLIYIKDLGQLYIEAICQVLDQLWKYSLFTNLEKCRFHQDEIRFLKYVVSFKNISIEVKKIEVIKEWPKPKSVWDIQVFLDFANFYQQFIQDFSKIAASFTSILKTIVLSQVLVANEVLAVNEVGSVENGDKLIEICGKLSKTRKLSKSQKSAKSRKKLSKSENLPNFYTKKDGPSFLTSDAKMVFNHLQLAFTKASIL